MLCTCFVADGAATLSNLLCVVQYVLVDQLTDHTLVAYCCSQRYHSTRYMVHGTPEELNWNSTTILYQTRVVAKWS